MLLKKIENFDAWFYLLPLLWLAAVTVWGVVVDVDFGVVGESCVNEGVVVAGLFKTWCITGGGVGAIGNADDASNPVGCKIWYAVSGGGVVQALYGDDIRGVVGAWCFVNGSIVDVFDGSWLLYWFCSTDCCAA